MARDAETTPETPPFQDWLVARAEEVAEELFRLMSKVQTILICVGKDAEHTAFSGLASDLYNIHHRAVVNVEMCRRDPLEDARKAFQEMASQSGLSPEDMKSVLEALAHGR